MRSNLKTAQVLKASDEKQIQMRKTINTAAPNEQSPIKYSAFSPQNLRNSLPLNSRLNLSS